MVKRNNKGFSIIEVLIVLAIAGLIMLVVFLAVPALRRNAANNGRTSDASRVSAAVQECLSNKNGQISACDTTADIDVGTTSQLLWDTTNAVINVEGTTAIDSAAAYDLTATVTKASNVGTTALNPDAIKVAVIYKAKCLSTGDGAEASQNARDFVVMFDKKTQSGVTTVCIGS